MWTFLGPNTFTFRVQLYWFPNQLILEMSESYEDGVCGDGAPDFIPPRAIRSGRRSGVTVPLVERDEAVLLESVKTAPRRSSIIKVIAEARLWVVKSLVVRIVHDHVCLNENSYCWIANPQHVNISLYSCSSYKLWQVVILSLKACDLIKDAMLKLVGFEPTT